MKQDLLESLDLSQWWSLLDIITRVVHSFTILQALPASWLVCSTLEQVVRAQVLCSWARHYSRSASLHPGV